MWVVRISAPDGFFLKAPPMYRKKQDRQTGKQDSETIPIFIADTNTVTGKELLQYRLTNKTWLFQINLCPHPFPVID